MRMRKEDLGDRWEEYQKDRKYLKALRYKRKNVEKVVGWRRRTKRKLIEYKGGKCEICGFSKDVPCAYDFHHKDPQEKEFQISSRIRKYETLKKEVDKCMLLCKNCHAEIHEKKYEPNPEKAAMSFEKKIKELEDKWRTPFVVDEKRICMFVALDEPIKFG